MVFNNALLSASCPPASQLCVHIHTYSPIYPPPPTLSLKHTQTDKHTYTLVSAARFTAFLPNWAFVKIQLRIKVIKVRVTIFSYFYIIVWSGKGLANIEKQ